MPQDRIQKRLMNFKLITQKNNTNIVPNSDFIGLVSFLLNFIAEITRMCLGRITEKSDCEENDCEE